MTTPSQLSQHNLFLKSASKGDFAEFTESDWIKLAQKALGDKPYPAALLTETADQIAIKPLYTSNDWAQQGTVDDIPGQFPFIRGEAHSLEPKPWQVCQLFQHPDPAHNHQAIQEALDGGATGIALHWDDAFGSGLAPTDPQADTHCGKGGMIAPQFADVERALEGISLEQATFSLHGGGAFLVSANMWLVLLKKRQIDPASTTVFFNADPIHTLLKVGQWPLPMDVMRTALHLLTNYCATYLPSAKAITVNSVISHEAGASDAVELGVMLSTALQYLRWLHQAEGLSIANICRTLRFEVAIDANCFVSIAKLRAAKALWARLLDVLEEAPQPMTLYAQVSKRIFHANAPWNNLLRGTTSCFAGAIGGAAGISIPPWDVACGLPTAFAQRMSRNTQLLLQHESGLHQVLDGAGGAWYMESLTDEIAAKAWAHFQHIEASGGMLKAIQKGQLHALIHTQQQAAATQVNTCKMLLTGINTQPHLEAAPISAETADISALLSESIARLAASAQQSLSSQSLTPQSLSPQSLSSLPNIKKLRAAYQKANTPENGTILMAALQQMSEQNVSVAAFLNHFSNECSFNNKAQESSQPPITCEPLALHSLGKSFEALRQSSVEYQQQHGHPPQALLLHAAQVSDADVRTELGAELDWAAHFFACGGIHTKPIAVNAGAMDATDDSFSALESALETVSTDNARVVALCGFAADAPATEHLLTHLRHKGAKCIVWLGQKASKKTPQIKLEESEYQAIDHLVNQHTDVPAVLEAVLKVFLIE